MHNEHIPANIRLDEDEYILINHTSSEDVFKTNIFALSITLQEVFKMSLRRLAITSSRRLGRRKIATLKTCWRRLRDMSWRRIQDVLKTKKCLLGSNNSGHSLLEGFVACPFWDPLESEEREVENMIYLIYSLFYFGINKLSFTKTFFLLPYTYTMYKSSHNVNWVYAIQRIFIIST